MTFQSRSLKRKLTTVATAVNQACVRFAARDFAREIKQAIGGSVVFVPYTTLDCLALHNGLKDALSDLGVKGRTIFHDYQIDTSQYLLLSSINCEDHAFSALSIKAACSDYGISDLCLPLIDSIIRQAPADSLIQKAVINTELYEIVKLCYDQITELSCRYDACFLADTAYLRNHMLKQAFIKSGKRVFYLNPRGIFSEYKNIYRSEFSVDCPDEFMFKRVDRAVESYLKCRYSGQSKRDLDSRKAFAQQQSLSHFNSKKKVLYLHAFKDANNNTWAPDQAFSTYMEWVDYTLSCIAEDGKFDEWFLKIHPSSRYYDGDTQILQYFLDKYNVPGSSLDRCPSTREILQMRWPVYTNQGTIVLEAASMGYGAYYCGPRFDPCLGIYACTKSEWKSYLMKPVNHDPGLLRESSIDLAKYALWRSFEYRNIAKFCPDRPCLPSDKMLEKLKTWLSQIVNSLIQSTPAPRSFEADISIQ